MLILQTFVTGVIFEEPLLLGVNLGRLLFIGIVRWGILQATQGLPGNEPKCDRNESLSRLDNCCIFGSPRTLLAKSLSGTSIDLSI